MSTARCSVAALLLCSFAASALAEDIPAIARLLPDKGVALPDEDRTRLQAGLKDLNARVAKLGDHPLLADVRIYLKAVDLALRNGEFYDLKKDVPKADWALKEAANRLDQLKAAPWTQQKGSVIRGYISSVDGSAQPYGLAIPEKMDLGKPVPLYVWLHGRSSNGTDLHFLRQHGDDLHPDDAIVLHAFGRQCVGFKQAGEIDVLEAIAHAQTQYRIDPDRIALTGFSMGGAGAKHLGAHYADRFAVMHCGAGFADTSRYLGLKPADFPVWYEQALWGVYDVPDYVRNLFNLPVIAYSGDKDKQKDAALLLAEAYKANGQTLNHLIGPNTGHSYEPGVLKQVQAQIHEAIVKGRQKFPETVSFQTRTLRYPGLYWVTALGLEEHWKDTRIDAHVEAGGLRVTTTNVDRLRLTWPKLTRGGTIAIDGLTLKAGDATAGVVLAKQNGMWQLADGEPSGLRKSPGLQGPLDDAYMSSFVVVEPSGSCANPQVQRWVDFERHHFLERWASLMRGDARVRKDSEVSDADLRDSNLVLWGDPAANKLLARILDRLPLHWTAKELTLGGKTVDAASHVPALIFPNPLNPKRYVLINSGLTFREASDRTNSLQNPKLPDWALIDLSQAPNDTAPGRIVEAGFFDERWQVKPAKP